MGRHIKAGHPTRETSVYGTQLIRDLRDIGGPDQLELGTDSQAEIILRT